MSRKRETESYERMKFILEMGEILLSNGAEIFRVEETMDHLASFYQISHVDAYVLSNGIFITAEIEGKDYFAKVKHIPISSIHLGIVTEVNDLSREICAGKYTLEEARAQLEHIKRQPPQRKCVQILAAGIGSGCFCYLFQANFMECLATFVIAALLYIFVLYMEPRKVSKIVINIAGGALITVASVVISTLFAPYALSTNMMIIGSILPLIPGVAFTNAIRDIASSDYISGMVRMLDALLIFVYIAVGVGLALNLCNTFIGRIAV